MTTASAHPGESGSLVREFELLIAVIIAIAGVAAVLTLRGLLVKIVVLVLALIGCPAVGCWSRGPS